MILRIILALLISTSCFAAEFPAPSAFTNHGVVLSSTGVGYDYSYAGWTPSTVVKLNGTFYMYYCCTNGARGDDGPAYRALCVATSDDGITYTKYGSNPVMTYTGGEYIGNEEEEGIWSSSAVVNGSTIYLYYGALHAIGSSSVDVYVKLATSSDGYTFVDQGLTLDPPYNNGENTVFGVINETATAGALTGDWHVWFGKPHIAAMATGTTATNIADAGSISGESSDDWNGSCVTKLDSDTAIIIDGSLLSGYTAEFSDLTSFSPTGNDYLPGGGAVDIQGVAVYHDTDTGKWWIYYRSGGLNNTPDDTDTISAMSSTSSFQSMSGVTISLLLSE